MYTIHKTQFGPYDHYQIKDANDEESISIIPAFGGLINDWTVKTKSGLSRLLKNYEDHLDLNDNIDVNFQGPKLIPYPNRIENGQYTFNGQEYQLEQSKIGEPNSIHGFLCRLPMEVIEQVCEADRGSITLQHSYNGAESGYPFTFDIELTYQLHASDGLSILTRIRNTGDRLMPFGDGWHPYFACRDGIGSLELEFHAKGKLETNELAIPTGKLDYYGQFESLTSIASVQLDDCFELRDDHILLRYPDEDLTLAFWQEMGEGKYNYLQVYTPADSQSIAIEPMTCPPNAFNSGEGLIEIAPKEQIELRHGIKVIGKSGE
ncbi:MAG: hypothetical protein RIF33_20015 [Cyclobacteriaceae bacterium]